MTSSHAETSTAGAPKGTGLTPLTTRQLECLTWVEEGKTSWEIGQIMGISQRTVESYLAIVFDKLEVRTRVQAVVRARRLGLL